MNRELILICDACGEEVPQFVEGYCADCQADRQFRLNEHNARHDWWAKLTDRERGDQIRRAM